VCLETQDLFFVCLVTEHQTTRSLVNVKTKLTRQLHTRCDTSMFHIHAASCRSPLLVERLPPPCVHANTEHGWRRVATRVVLHTSHCNYANVQTERLFDTYLRPAVGPEGPGSRQMFHQMFDEHERQMFDQMFDQIFATAKCFTKC